MRHANTLKTGPLYGMHSLCILLRWLADLCCAMVTKQSLHKGQPGAPPYAASGSAHTGLTSKPYFSLILSRLRSS